MASVSGNMKGFYRQRKKANSSSKSSAKASTSSKKSLTLGSDVAQPPALVSHGGTLDLKDDVDEYEEMLRQFDMNMAYGPCLGMSRLARWERARKLGLNPPEEIEVLLKGGKVQTDCLWDGRI